jgi:hypothetical protein
MQQVKSSLIKSIGYNPLTEQLSVVLHTSPSTVFNYDGVSRATVNNFTNATSKGQFFNSKIRGRFPTSKSVI